MEADTMDLDQNIVPKQGVFSGSVSLSDETAAAARPKHKQRTGTKSSVAAPSKQRRFTRQQMRHGARSEGRLNVTSQRITPNPNVPCRPGMCLEYVRETFGLPPKYSSATAGWNASTRQHANLHFPKGVWTPVWFSLQDNPHGHVALRQPDGSIWSSSSPKSTQPVHHPSLQDLLDYYRGRLTYLGWTEDIEGVMIMDRATQAVSQYRNK